MSGNTDVQEADVKKTASGFQVLNQRTGQLLKTFTGKDARKNAFAHKNFIEKKWAQQKKAMTASNAVRASESNSGGSFTPDSAPYPKI